MISMIISRYLKPCNVMPNANNVMFIVDAEYVFKYYR